MTITTPVAAEAVKAERPRVSDRTRAENRLAWKLVAPAGTTLSIMLRFGLPVNDGEPLPSTWTSGR